MPEPLRVLELYSGIGGMHLAMKESGISADIIAAVDINTTANEIYRHNFPHINHLQRNIESLSSEELNLLLPDALLMSPPCQPFTRVGLKKDTDDDRTVSFLHILHLLPLCSSLSYILLENVKGFEISSARHHLVETLDQCGFQYQEFLLSPQHLGVPNSRMRYFLLAKRKPLKFCFVHTDKVMESIPAIWCRQYCGESVGPEYIQKLWELGVKQPCRRLRSEPQMCACSLDLTQNSEDCVVCDSFGCTDTSSSCSNNKQESTLSDTTCQVIDTYLEKETEDYFEEYYLSEKTLSRHAMILDIVTRSSRSSCCFTKAYGHYAEGTGSVLQNNDEILLSAAYSAAEKLPSHSAEYIEQLKKLKLRYFTPTEIARLMGFPKSFTFPVHTTKKQKYRVLGNSLNVHVVAVMLLLLFGGDNVIKESIKN